MSFANPRWFTKLRMASTHGFVSVARVGVDMSNRFIAWLTLPMRKRWRGFVGDAPWVPILLGALMLQYGPSPFIPALGAYITPNTRTVLEQERVRKELQQGHDPYPYLENRENMYGAVYHNKESAPELAPRSAVPEFQSLDNLRRVREARLKKDLEEMEKKVSDLESNVDGDSTDRTTKWLRTGFK